MHMRIDATRERETIFSIKDLLGVLGLNVRPEPGDFSILDRNIETIDRGLIRTNDNGILDDSIEKLIHARHSLDYWSNFTLRLLSLASCVGLSNSAPRMTLRAAPNARCLRAQSQRIP